MVRNASRALKIGVHLPFGPKFDVANRTFYPEKFRLAYYTFSIIDLNILTAALAPKLTDLLYLNSCEVCQVEFQRYDVNPEMPVDGVMLTIRDLEVEVVRLEATPSPASTSLTSRP